MLYKINSYNCQHSYYFRAFRLVLVYQTQIEVGVSVNSRVERDNDGETHLLDEESLVSTSQRSTPDAN